MAQSYSGVDGIATFGSIDADVKGYSLDVEDSGYNSRTTSNAGWDHTSNSFIKVSGSFDAFFHSTTNPFTMAGVVFGRPSVYPNLSFALGGSKTAAGAAKIEKISVKSETSDGITYTMSFTSRGAWTLPT